MMTKTEAQSELDRVLNRYTPLKRVDSQIYELYDGGWGIYIEGKPSLWAAWPSDLYKWCATLPKCIDASVEVFLVNKKSRSMDWLR